MSGIFYTSFPTAMGIARIAWGAKGLLLIEFPDTSERSFLNRLQRHFRDKAVRDDTSQKIVRTALQRYFAGQKETFAGIRVDTSAGTPFEQAVWRGIRRIPYGRTRSYGELARAIGRPRAARAVGRACGMNPLPPVIPCHRVVGSDGSLTGYSGKGGVSLKRKLLDMEIRTLRGRG